MSLTKAQTLTFAGSLCLDLDNTTTISQYFDDIADELGKLASPPFVDQTWQKVTAATADYSYPSTAIRLLYVFYDDELLSPATEMDLRAYSEDWEADSGTPDAYTQAHVTARTFTLYPNPDTTGDATGGADWGSSFPENDLSIFFAEDRATDIEDYYVLPIAFDCLARDFSYPSAHQDLEYSAICTQLASFLYQLAGVQK